MIKAMQRFLGLLMVVVFFTSSCVEQIEFPLNKGLEKLIVSGQLTDLKEEQYVFLSETTSSEREPLLSGQNYILNDLPRPVSHAQVSLVNDRNESWSYSEVEPGKYQLNENFGQAEEGVFYHIQIQIQGKIYRSEPELIPEHVGEDELSYSFTRAVLDDQPETAFISIETQVTLPEKVGGYYLRWDVDEAYYWYLTFFPNAFNKPPPDCIVFGIPDPERITLINGDQLNSPGGKSSQIVAQRLVDQSFLSRHYFNVRQLSISKDAYEYWRRVRELVNNTGSVFDTPPAPIQGNLYNVDNPDEVVLGYFEVSKAKVSRIYTTLADVPFFLEKICEYDPNRRRDQYDRTCLSCGVFPNSQEAFPDWWFDQ